MNYAGVMKLVNITDLKSVALWLAGSNPAARTNRS